jgi:hypothetical protein
LVVPVAPPIRRQRDVEITAGFVEHRDVEHVAFLSHQFTRVQSGDTSARDGNQA